MNEPRPAGRKPLGMIVAAVMAVGAIWAGVGFAADSGSGSTPSPSSQPQPSYAQSSYAPTAADTAADDPNCPNMGGSGSGSGSDNNGGGSTTPSTSDGSTNSGL